jgi:hypothetical protein
MAPRVASIGKNIGRTYSNFSIFECLGSCIGMEVTVSKSSSPLEWVSSIKPGFTNWLVLGYIVRSIRRSDCLGLSIKLGFTNWLGIARLIGPVSTSRCGCLGIWIINGFVLIQANIKRSKTCISKPITIFSKISGFFTPNTGKRIFKSNPPNSKKAMPSPTINKRFSQKDSFLIRKINEMRKPGNKIQVQKEMNVVVYRKLTCVSSSILAKRSIPSKREKIVFLPNITF